MDTQPTQMQITIANHFKFDCMLLENFDDNRPSEYEGGSRLCQKWVCAEVTDFRSGRSAWHIVEIKSPIEELDLCIDPGDYYFSDTFDYDAWYVKLVTSRLESALECAMDIEENILAE
jgi:hypothetical protein